MVSLNEEWRIVSFRNIETRACGREKDFQAALYVNSSDIASVGTVLPGVLILQAIKPKAGCKRQVALPQLGQECRNEHSLP